MSEDKTPKIDLRRVYRTRRQTNRQIINSDLERKINTVLKNQHNILESGESENLKIEASQKLRIKVNTCIQLSKDMKIIITPVSNDQALSGISYYRNDVNDNDNSFVIIVENNGLDEHVIKFDYVII